MISNAHISYTQNFKHIYLIGKIWLIYLGINIAGQHSQFQKGYKISEIIYLCNIIS